MKFKPWVTILLPLLLIVSLAAAGSIFFAYRWLHQPIHVADGGIEHTVAPGTSLTAVIYQLYRDGILDHPRILITYARLSDNTAVKAGEYRLSADESAVDLLRKFGRGEVINYRVTLVEGWTFREALSSLHEQEKIAATLISPESVAQFIDSLQLQGSHPEGWFFPDTYHYTLGTTDVDVLEQAHRRMSDILETEWQARDPFLPYQNSYQALIMASIIERETGQAGERGQIAGVFVRRLQKGMRLRTDPTVIYGLGENYQGNLRRRHLSQRTPYNTYVIFGLPPTPIALPGREAIHAALHPEQGDALYFVARGDGSHHFSATLEEHNRAVRRFQIYQRRENYQSAPQTSSQEPSTANQSSANPAPSDGNAAPAAESQSDRENAEEGSAGL